MTAASALHPLPARATLRQDGLHVGLADIPPGEMRDPFLQDTLRRVAAELTLTHCPRPEETPADTGAAPAGLIFHVGRCGSTLASQLLKLQPGLAVYSEPPAINELLVAAQGASRARLVGALRTMAQLFSRHAAGPYVVKLSSWNVLFCDVLTEAFPSSPWALCLRDPLEVCVSLEARPPGWLREPAGALRPFLGVAEGTQGGPTARNVVHAFASFCAAAERLEPSRGLLLHYEGLPEAVWQQLLPRLQMRADECTEERMRSASRQDAKAPVGQARPFAVDGERKRLAASAELRRGVEAIARPAMQRLIERMTA
ncbi:hypothetical protein [Ideonella sp. YS5]|uniref:hypothetical protein n=1 Tax=Ideonella sp. YS5 TaxID=3453714 RepID=UPI003EEE0038